MRKNIAIIFVVMGLNTTIVSALVISEIMYDPQGSDTDREWIEVLNDTQSSIDMTGWKFFEANTNHGLAISKERQYCFRVSMRSLLMCQRSFCKIIPRTKVSSLILHFHFQIQVNI